MIKRSALLFILAAVLVTFVSSAALAQLSPTPIPDAGVKGNGAIYTRVQNVGVFDINVARTGNILFGGFKYQEISTTSNRRTVIYSQRVTALDISGNTAKITAQGYWNNMPSIITVEVLDDNPSGDWFRIVAKPQNMLTIIYDEAGGVIKGDVTVFSALPVPDAYTKGDGAIALGNNTGIFRFYAERTNNIVKGNLFYTEYNPISASIRPVASINVRYVNLLKVDGNTAYFSGIGNFNGRRALVEVEVTDNANPPYPTFAPVPDTFRIKAGPDPNTDSYSWLPYEAGGPLVKGDIVVAVRQRLAQ